MSAECSAENIPPGYKQTEVGVIPEDWDFDYIENLSHITTGGRNTQDRVDDGRYPFFVRSQTVERINSYSFDGEAVLTAGDGVGTGKVFHYINGKFDAHQRVYRISEFNERIKGYFFYLYFSTHFYNRIMQMTAKSSVDSVRREMIARMLIPVPPKVEQESIAEALSDTDALIESLEQLIAKKSQIKQGAMQELLTGKRRLPGFEAKRGYKQTEVGVIPEDWEITTLGEVVSKLVHGGTPSTKYEDYWNGDIPWITGADILDQQVSEIRRFITKNAVKNSSTNVVNEGNLLLVSRTGVGKLAIARCDIAISQDLTGIYTKSENLTTEYLFRFLDKNQSLLKNQNQGTSILGITRETLSSIIIFFPPTKAEQEAIANILSDMDAEITALEEKLAKTRQIKQGIMQELLTGRIRLV